MNEGLDSTDQSPSIARTPNEYQPHIETDLRAALDARSGLEQESQVKGVSETPELRRLKGTLERRERQLASLRYQLAVKDWKLTSLRQRRWWRIGTELGELRRRPLSMLTLPVRLLRVIRNPKPRLPRPTPPPELVMWRPLPSSEVGNDERTRPLQTITPRHDVAALSILSPELSYQISHEVHVFDLDLEKWQEQMAAYAPQLLLVESFTPSEAHKSLPEIVERAAATGIVTVLWDTEPTSLPDELKTRFDRIVGNGMPPAEGYRGQLVTRRGLVQPSVHNPIGSHRHFKSADIELAKCTIADIKYQTLSELADATKNYKVLHSVTSAELADLAPIAATGTPVVVQGDSHRFGIPTESDEEAEAMERSLLKSEVLRARLTHPQMRQAFREFNISLDVNELLKGTSSEWPLIDVMVPTNRPRNITKLFDNLGRQTYPKFRVFLVAHGVELDSREVEEQAERAGVRLESLINVPEDVILGEVFNLGFSETEADIVAKMDDDDYYGAEYLWDLYSALDFSGAEVAGKWAHYAYLEGPDSLVYRYPDYEYHFTDVVAISTLLMHRDVLEAERFPAMPWGSGSVFLRALGAHGARVFAADRWNYLYVRGQNGERNTFPISDLRLLSISEVVCRGMNVDEVIV